MTIDRRQEIPLSSPYPADFRWGAATAAYQIEGAVEADGRGKSIWDVFAHTPGRVLNGETGDIAIDHYRRYRDDVAMMADLGLTAYRFSVSWPRVQPTGRGAANQAGLGFYDRLVDELLGHDIEPWLTLYHWDLPQALEDAGGWPERDTAARFADYAMLVHGALGDRVKRWTTLNEPWCSAFLGYGSGDHAPGRRDGAAAVRATHHLLLGHGLATREIHSADAEAEVGITLNLYAVSPSSGTPADQDAARRIDGLANRFFLDPVLCGRYPDDVVQDLAQVSDFDHVRDNDMAIISTPLSMLGINYYTRHVVGDAGFRADDRSAPGSAWPGSEHVVFCDRGLPVTQMGWEIDADGLREVLLRVAAEYPAIPLYITENGAAFDDELGPDGAVDDQRRIGYLDEHLRVCADVVAAGVPLHGYFAWSMFDNFEWAWGYSRRFGLVYVDYDTQRRTPKASAAWYAESIRRWSGTPSSVGGE